MPLCLAILGSSEESLYASSTIPSISSMKPSSEPNSSEGKNTISGIASSNLADRSSLGLFSKGLAIRGRGGCDIEG